MKKTILKSLFVFLISILILCALTITFYLKGLSVLVESDYVLNWAKKACATILKMDLEIKNPKLKTHIKPYIDFSVDNLVLKKNDIVLIELKDLKSSVSFKNIFQKEIKLDKLQAKTLLVKADELEKNFPVLENNSDGKSDYKIIFLNSKINLEEFELSYKINKAIIDVYVRDIILDCKEEYKNSGFYFESKIYKNNKLFVDVVAPTIDEVKIYDDKIIVENLNVVANKSKVKLNAVYNNKGLFINAVSKKFLLSDIFEIVKSDVAISNGENLLLPLVNPNGSVAFDVDYNNGDLSGQIDIKDTSLKIKDLTALPITVNTGKVKISKNKIDLINLIGFYGKNKKNNLKIYGDIKDYYKTFDSNITIDTVITNEFFKDYLAPLINNTVLHISNPSGTRIIYKAKNNIMDITWLAKISKGVDFGIEKEKSPLTPYDRVVKGDFNITGDKINIKNINYYIASDIRRGVKLTPIVIIDGLTDFSGNLYNVGFKFGREMPSEFLNIFTHEKTFQKGTIKGDLHVIFKDNIPYLNADMEMNGTFIPEQRLYIKNAKLTTNSDLINLDMKGGFKRVKYDFKGKVKNELKPPFVIKDMMLSIDNIDVEKFLTSLASNQNEQQGTIASNDGLYEDDNYMFDTNLIRIENADFVLDKGNYKELNFGNIKAKLTLDENGILKIQSNKFDIAEGISTLKVESDLKNLTHYIRLGVKEVNSDIMARVLFNLDKEITGLASGLIELNTDKTLKMNGKIQFLVNEGTIGKIGLVEYLMKVASVFRNPIVMISPGAIIDIVNMPEGKFDKITGELKIKSNVIYYMKIQSYSKTLSALIRGRFDLDKHDTSLRIYTRFSSKRKSMFGFLRNMSLNALANKVQMNSRNDANYYESELKELPQIEVDESQTQVFLTQVEGDVENNNFISSLKKIK